MNINPLSEAKGLLGECATAVEREVDVVELLRFAYYYALKRREREDRACEWLAEHRPDELLRLAAPEEEIVVARRRRRP